MKYICIVFLISILYAAEQKVDFFSPDNIELNDDELKHLDIMNEFLSKDSISVMGENGTIRFLYGHSYPTIITTPLHTTDIVLQEGETISDVQIGDTVRWVITISTSGTGANTTSHIIIKPTDTNLATNLIILTNRRVYRMKLVSKPDEFFSAVGFEYTDKLQATLAKYKEYLAQRNKSKESQMFQADPDKPAVDISLLDFNYKIDGDADFKPVRVYNDGQKTYIQMPANMTFYEAPVLMILDNSGDSQMVNYRLRNDRFIVDRLFQKAILYSGVGFFGQEKITITKTHNDSYKNEVIDNVLYDLSGTN